TSVPFFAAEGELDKALIILRNCLAAFNSSSSASACLIHRLASFILPRCQKERPRLNSVLAVSPQSLCASSKYLMDFSYSHVAAISAPIWNASLGSRGE